MTSKNDLSSSKDEFKALLAKRLFQIRNLRGYSLEKVAEEGDVGLTPQQMHNHEIAASNMLPFHLDQYAKFYQVPVGYFYGQDENKEFLNMNADKRNMMISVEVIKSPDEVKILLYHLAKVVNKITSDAERTEQAA